jgi:ATP-dependent Clp protease ATP-binding subunit ClpA
VDGVFERFTEKAIKVIMLAQEEARRLGHNFVGTEQILLGLIGEGTGIAAKTLKSAGITLKETRVAVEKIIGRGSGFVAVEIPFTPRAKRALELSWDEARVLGHNWIGTEHLLLGVLREGGGVAYEVLENYAVDFNELRRSIIDEIQRATEKGNLPAARIADRLLESDVPIDENLKRVLRVLRLAEARAIALSKSELATVLKRYAAELSEEFSKMGFSLPKEVSAKETPAPAARTTAFLDGFTEKATKVVTFAGEESVRLGHNFIGTEQILLGLIKEGTGIAAKVLKTLGVNVKNARIEVEKIIGRGSGFISAEIPYTPRTRRVFELAQSASQQLGHDKVGTEHLLLGLVREGEGVGARVLENLEIDFKEVEQRVLEQIEKR